VPGLVILVSVTRRSDAVSVRSKIVELGSSLVPIVSAFPAMVATIASVAHKQLLQEIKLHSITRIPQPRRTHSKEPGSPRV
jgi:hypothetical protein